MISNQKGFTLIEVMVASMLFVVGILGVITMFMSNIKYNAQGKYMTEAAALASDKIEELRNIPFTNLSAQGNGTNANIGANLNMTRNYTAVWTNITGLRLITVRVEWPTGAGTKSVELKTSRFEE